MSVLSARQPLVIVPFDLTQPGFPIAQWMGGATVVGDLSGGLAQCVIGPASDPLAVAYVWSLDGFSCSKDTVAASNWRASWDPGWPQLATVTRVVDMGVDQTDVAGLGSAGVSRHLASMMPLSHPTPRSGTWSLVITAVNINLVNYFAAAWGRCWAADVWRKGGPKGYLPS